MLIDFEESFEKPKFSKRHGYALRRPNGPFLLLNDDVTENIEAWIYS